MFLQLAGNIVVVMSGIKKEKQNAVSITEIKDA